MSWCDIQVSPDVMVASSEWSYRHALSVSALDGLWERYWLYGAEWIVEHNFTGLKTRYAVAGRSIGKPRYFDTAVRAVDDALGDAPGGVEYDHRARVDFRSAIRNRAELAGYRGLERPGARYWLGLWDDLK